MSANAKAGTTSAASKRAADNHSPDRPLPGARKVVEFERNDLLTSLFGQNDEHLSRLESALGVGIVYRGNRVEIEGAQGAVEQAEAVLQQLYGRLSNGLGVDLGDVEGALRLTEDGDTPKVQKPRQAPAVPKADIHINTRKRTITPRSKAQGVYMAELAKREMVFGVGPAGTGKTYLAVATGVAKLLSGEVDRLILSRPAVEAGESLGFLPGDMKEKVDPYLRPLYDALYDTLPTGQVEKRFATGQIEIAPLAFMRGRTLGNAYIILDEAQNTTPMQMKMFLTRFGPGSRMVIAGDPTQVDLPVGTQSGLSHALDVLNCVEGVGMVHFTNRDIVRHALVGRIVDAYTRDDEQKANRAKRHP